MLVLDKAITFTGIAAFSVTVAGSEDIDVAFLSLDEQAENNSPIITNAEIESEYFIISYFDGLLINYKLFNNLSNASFV